MISARLYQCIRKKRFSCATIILEKQKLASTKWVSLLMNTQVSSLSQTLGYKTKTWFWLKRAVWIQHTWLTCMSLVSWYLPLDIGYLFKNCSLFLAITEYIFDVLYNLVWVVVWSEVIPLGLRSMVVSIFFTCTFYFVIIFNVSGRWSTAGHSIFRCYLSVGSNQKSYFLHLPCPYALWKK